ncbi:hypothetical protein ACQP1O_02125 [Nocardia sp. CA-151230]|uniref:hypothetical protein n=1 Tax=Nocardia sp. CA-151230 TaxID=3239982 RepID=UPI003D8FC104
MRSWVRASPTWAAIGMGVCRPCAQVVGGDPFMTALDADHLAIVGSRRAAMVALNALDPEHPRPVPCEFVPPFTG